jgi:hypothetical protein
VASGPAGRPAVGCFLVIGLLVVLGILFALIQDASQDPVAAGFGLFSFVAVSVLLVVSGGAVFGCTGNNSSTRNSNTRSRLRSRERSPDITP